MAKIRALLERVDENMRDARVESLSAQNRLRAAYDAAVFCALVFAEAERIPSQSEEPEDMLRTFAGNVGQPISQDVILLSRLHRKCDYQTAHTVTDADATTALDSATRIQKAVTDRLRKQAT